VRRRLARLLLDQSSVLEARRTLRDELRRIRVDSGEAHFEDLKELGGLLIDARLFRDALWVLGQAHLSQPGDAQILHMMGVAHFERGERSLGMDATRRALRVAPTMLPALHNMALACIHEKRWALAEGYICQALAIDPDDHGVRRLRLLLRLHRVASVGAWIIRRRPSFGA
jgi:hypothetical protein